MPLEIVPGIYQLRAYACQVFALLEDHQVTLIDAGGPGSGRLVLRQLRQLGRGPEEIKNIVLTHYHIDHRGAADELRRASGATVYIHELEAPYLRGERPFPNPVQSATLARLTDPLFVAMRGRPVPAVSLTDAQSLPILGGLSIHHVPGHTQGSIALSLPDQGILFSGDAMGFGRRELEIPDRLVSEDTDQARDSIERMARLDVDTICFSHFLPLRHGAHDALHKLVSSWADEA
jgi:glyoxylase-like metal-dependent hydrolase (beta-lactamase superfamily II)